MGEQGNLDVDWKDGGRMVHSELAMLFLGSLCGNDKYPPNKSE